MSSRTKRFRPGSVPMNRRSGLRPRSLARAVVKRLALETGEGFRSLWKKLQERERKADRERQLCGFQVLPRDWR